MTNATRSLHHIIDNLTCQVCGFYEENGDHNMCNYPAALMVWRKLGALMTEEHQEKLFKDWVIEKLKRSNSNNEDWPCVFAVTCWWLWKWSSARSFENNCSIPLDHVSFILVVNLLVAPLPTNSPYHHLIKKFKALISRADWEVTVEHVYQEGNRAVDWLANYGIIGVKRLEHLEEVPRDPQ
ncbi:hypothetical protein RDABS01_009885, partial [Bienertia sinuspersici]